MKHLVLVLSALLLSGCASNSTVANSRGLPASDSDGQFAEQDAQVRAAGLERNATSSLIVVGIGRFFVVRHAWPTSAAEILGVVSEENRGIMRHYLGKITHLQLVESGGELLVRYHLDTKNGVIEERLKLQPKPTEVEILDSVDRR